MQVFDYDLEEVKKHLKGDQALLSLIQDYGYIERYYRLDAERVLFETILGQQISNQVLEKLILRFEKEDLFKPENMVKKKVSELLDLGLSQRKAHLLLELAKDLLEGRLDLYKAYREHSVYDELLKYHGIGPWTVDMLLIFAFADGDVLSFHDYGIRKAYALLYHRSKVDKKDFTLFQKRMSPYGTIISFYLWALSNDS